MRTTVQARTGRQREARPLVLNTIQEGTQMTRRTWTHTALGLIAAVPVAVTAFSLPASGPVHIKNDRR